MEAQNQGTQTHKQQKNMNLEELKIRKKEKMETQYADIYTYTYAMCMKW